MLNFFLSLTTLEQSLLAGIFTFLITALGSALVLFFKDINKLFLDSMLAFSAGIMIASSFFSLLNPAIELSNSWFTITSSFMLGGLIILLCDKLITSMCQSKTTIKDLRMSLMLFISITLHNIPEGFVIGVAYASLANNNIIGALSLTLGIAIQNFPEGSAISFPLRREGVNRTKAFIIGTLSALPEPIAAVLGALLVLKVNMILPFIMSLTAGAMIYVTVKELIPESQNNKKQGLMTLFLMLGFSLMMILEII